MLPINSRTDRMMARIAISILSLGLLFGLWSFGRPVYWRFYATVVHPFEPGPTAGGQDEDPFAAAFLEGGATTSGGPDRRSTITNTDKPKVVDPVKETKPAEVKQAPVKQPFDVNNFPLSKERVLSFMQDGYIMVTWANHHYLDFARSWTHHVKKAGISGYLVGSMDDDILKQLYESDIHTWRMNTGIHKGDLGWGSPNFHKMGRFKINLIKQFLDLAEITVVISDIDTAWLRNPYPFFNKYPEADILTSTDELRESVPGEELERYPQAAAAFNIGIMVFRPKSKEFVVEWIKELEKPNMWDQTAFNDLVRHAAKHSEPPKNLFLGDEGKLTVGILPASIFASGHMFFVQKKYEELKLKPYVAHATFQYSGTPGKRNRFREFMHWWDPPEYYDSPKGFLSFEYNIPKDIWDRASKPMLGDQTVDKLKDHFDLVHWQMARLRTALVLASITGRTIVMPKIWCQLDKYWAPLYDGNIPGSKFIKPFVCPMDHVLDIEGGWFPKRDEREWGPHIDWREYSFIQNPALSQAVNNSRATLVTCGAGEANCAKGDAPAVPAGDGKVRIDASLDTTKFAAALAGVKDKKILHVPAPSIEALAQLWTRFPPDQKERFMRRLKHYTSVFCCLKDQPGWVWYDLFYDIPHEDRMNRKFDTWHWKMGDNDEHKRPARRTLMGSPAEQAALGQGQEGGQRGLVSLPQQQPFLQAMEQGAMMSWP